MRAVRAVAEVVHDRAGGTASLVTIAADVPRLARDDHPGAEVVSVEVAELLGRGWALLSAASVQAVGRLPCPAGWSVRGLDVRGRIVIGTGVEVLYDGDLGPDLPAYWSAGLAAQGGYLIVCVAGDGVDLTRTDLVDHLAWARGRGQVVAARVPVLPTSEFPAPG